MSSTSTYPPTPLFTSARSRHVAGGTRHIHITPVVVNHHSNENNSHPNGFICDSDNCKKYNRYWSCNKCILLVTILLIISITALYAAYHTSYISLQSYTLYTHTSSNNDNTVQHSENKFSNSNNVYYVSTKDGYIETQKLIDLKLDSLTQHNNNQINNDLSIQNVLPQQNTITPTPVPLIQQLSATQPILTQSPSTTPTHIPSRVRSTALPAVQSVSTKKPQIDTTNKPVVHVSKSIIRSKHIHELSQSTKSQLPIRNNQTLLPHNEELYTLLHTVNNKMYTVNTNILSIQSPGNQLQLTLAVDTTGKLLYSIDDTLNQSIIKPSTQTLQINSTDCTYNIVNNKLQLSYTIESGYSYWRPVPSTERSEYDASYKIIKLWCTGPQCSQSCHQHSWLTEFRIYDYSIASRSLIIPYHNMIHTTGSNDINSMISVNWYHELKLDKNVHSLCTGSNYEEPYTHVNCSELTPTVMTPVTIELYNTNTLYKHIAVLQSSGLNYMGATVGSISQSKHNTILLIEHRGEAYINPTRQYGILPTTQFGYSTPTSWNVLLLVSTQIQLIEYNYIVPLLCEPVSTEYSDTRWIPTGKSLRVRSHTASEAIQWIDFAVEYNYQFVHFDAGWYGDEYNKHSTSLAVLPALANKLDMKQVTSYAHQRNIQVSLYVNDLALRDSNKLYKLYPKWGIDGIKFGFVDVEKPSSITLLHTRIIEYGIKSHMFVNVHDAYRPRGLHRTYPWLISVEGVRGEERKPDATHHTYIPFTRTLQGTADYTPRYLTNGIHCTHTHQLALPIIIYNQIQSLFWAEPYNAVKDAYIKYMPELSDIWSTITTTWSDTRVLSGRAGQYVSIARRINHVWYIGTITNNSPRTITIDINQLFMNQSGHPQYNMYNQHGYILTIYNDGVSTGKSDPFQIKVMPKLQYYIAPYHNNSSNNYKLPYNTPNGMTELTDMDIKIVMAGSGGNVMKLQPIDIPIQSTQISTI